MCTLAYILIINEWVIVIYLCMLRSCVHAIAKQSSHAFFFPLVEWWIVTFHKALLLFILYTLHGRCFIFWSAHYPFERKESLFRGGGSSHFEEKPGCVFFTAVDSCTEYERCLRRCHLKTQYQ